MSNEHFFSTTSWQEQALHLMKWWWCLLCTSSLKQQSTGICWHVAALGHIILIPRQPVIACLAEKQQIPIL